jgi:hypothetical protein
MGYLFRERVSGLSMPDVKARGQREKGIAMWKALMSDRPGSD